MEARQAFDRRALRRIRDPVGVRRRIGYVSQSGSTGPEAQAGEEVVSHGRLYGMSTAEATERGT
ncbi:MAG: hypothetical protein ACXVH1_06765, partial [Solirubrobacteraceae bacterium]